MKNVIVDIMDAVPEWRVPLNYDPAFITRPVQITTSVIFSNVAYINRRYARSWNDILQGKMLKHIMLIEMPSSVSPVRDRVRDVVMVEMA